MNNEIFSDLIMGVKEASELWGLGTDRIKALCQNDIIICKKIGNSWSIYKHQENPKKYKKAQSLN